jgi:hypothetical protein
MEELRVVDENKMCADQWRANSSGIRARLGKFDLILGLNVSQQLDFVGRSEVAKTLDAFLFASVSPTAELALSNGQHANPGKARRPAHFQNVANGGDTMSCANKLDKSLPPQIGSLLV